MRLPVLIFLLLCSLSGFSTHLRGGEIRIKKGLGLTCTITITVYTNTGSIIRFSNQGLGEVNFGDGSPIHNPPQRENSPIPGMGSEFGYVSYSVVHTFPSQGQYVVSYFEHNLNADIVNVTNSVETPFYIESSFTLDPASSYSSPSFVSLPIFVFPIQQEFSYSSAAVDTVYRYRYQLTTPKQGSDSYVAYQTIPTVAINEHTGLMTWDTKFDGSQQMEGTYLFSIKVRQYDKDLKLTGWVQRSLQVILEDLTSKIAITNPLPGPDSRIVVLTDQTRVVKLILEDIVTSENLGWEVKTDSTLEDNVSLEQYDSSTASKQMKVALLSLHTTAAFLRDFPYVISLRGRSSIGTQEAPVLDANILLFTKDVAFPAFPADPPLVTGLQTETTLSCYPNPFHSYLVVKGLGNDGAEISLVNLFGQSIFQRKVANDESVDTSDLPAGIYILRVAGRNGTRWKVLKQ